jgi:hypothetical protein
VISPIIVNKVEALLLLLLSVALLVHGWAVHFLVVGPGGMSGCTNTGIVPSGMEMA